MTDLNEQLRELVKNSGVPYGRERGDLYRAIRTLINEAVAGAEIVAFQDVISWCDEGRDIRQQAEAALSLCATPNNQEAKQ